MIKAGFNVNYEALKERQFFLRSDFPEGFEQNMRDPDRWSMLADRYDAFQELPALPVGEHIPKLIHQIWIGGKLPEAYRPLTESWKRINKGWEYRFWDEKAILDFGLVNERAFRLSPSYGVKSDIARYEILERLGGFYADTDFECLRPFDELAKKATFVAGTIFNPSPEINNALLGSVSHHPFLIRLIQGLSEPVYSKDGMKILASSGPHYFTRNFFEYSTILRDTDIVMPSTYFYPFPNYAEPGSYFSSTRDRYAKDWSLAIHYWEASWLKPSALRLLLSRVKKKVRSVIVPETTKPRI